MTKGWVRLEVVTEWQGVFLLGWQAQGGEAFSHEHVSAGLNRPAS